MGLVVVLALTIVVVSPPHRAEAFDTTTIPLVPASAAGTAVLDAGLVAGGLTVAAAGVAAFAGTTWVLNWVWDRSAHPNVYTVSSNEFRASWLQEPDVVNACSGGPSHCFAKIHVTRLTGTTKSACDDTRVSYYDNWFREYNSGGDAFTDPWPGGTCTAADADFALVTAGSFFDGYHVDYVNWGAGALVWMRQGTPTFHTECRAADGVLSEYTATGSTYDGTGSLSTEFPACPSGSHATKFWLTVVPGVGSTSARTLGTVTTIDPAIDSPSGPYPDCTYYVGSSPCKVMVFKQTATGPKSCAVAAIECTHWQTRTDGATFECRWGDYNGSTGVPGTRSYALPLSDCQTAYPDTAFDTETETGTEPQPQPSTGTGTGTIVQNDSDNTVPRDVAGPGAAGAPCFPVGWGYLNPIEWVQKPVQCALRWAFVPDAATVLDTATSVLHDLKTQYPFAPLVWFGTTVTHVYEDVSTAIGGECPTGNADVVNGIYGPELTIGEAHFHAPMFDLCSSYTAEARGYVRPVSAVAFIIWTVFMISKLVMVAIGGVDLLRHDGLAPGEQGTLF